ncbi:MAG: hypothetical protein ACJ8EK_09745 [Bradyrhizobium sp.]
MGTDAAGIETGSAAMADFPSIPNRSLRISIARPFEARSFAKQGDLNRSRQETAKSATPNNGQMG